MTDSTDTDNSRDGLQINENEDEEEYEIHKVLDNSGEGDNRKFLLKFKEYNRREAL